MGGGNQSPLLCQTASVGVAGCYWNRSEVYSCTHVSVSFSNRRRNVTPESTPGRSLFRGSIVGFCSCILRLDQETSSQCLIGSIFGAVAVVTRVICPPVGRCVTTSEGSTMFQACSQQSHSNSKRILTPSLNCCYNEGMFFSLPNPVEGVSVGVCVCVCGTMSHNPLRSLSVKPCTLACNQVLLFSSVHICTFPFSFYKLVAGCCGRGLISSSWGGGGGAG